MDNETRVGLIWAAKEIVKDALDDSDEPYHLCNTYLLTWKAYHS